jgi:anhydro-N-acetylmuramic acid kinase
VNSESNNLHNINKNVFLGIMSGTSLDGVDVAAVSFVPSFKLIAFSSYPMPEDLKEKILELCTPSANEIEKQGDLDIALGHFFAHCCLLFCQEHQAVIDKEHISAIGLHGQTIRHRPFNQPKHNFTLQIADANTVAEITGLTTIADFRRRDIAAGGQGAPLVPAFHQSIFMSSEHKRAIINIGGMANLTLLAKDDESPLLGFDTGPGNVLMDAWIHQQKGLSFDKNGEWAKTGNINHELLSRLISLDFFTQDIPKSTGREQFNLAWVNEHLNHITQRLSDADIQATLTELSALSIANEIARYNFDDAQLYVCGGGAYNQYLMDRLRINLPKATCVDSTATLNLAPDCVEAVAFAWLAQQTLSGLTSNSPSVTGAQGDRILGAIYQA